MYSWGVIEWYCQFHSRWFESVDNYTPSDAHLDVYRSIIPDYWRLRRDGIWFVAEPSEEAPLPDQGWKLHISVRSRDSGAALRHALPVLAEAHTSFKFIVDPHITSLVNGKLWPRGSSGKFITVYPKSQDELMQLGHELSKNMQGFAGPYILSDHRWPRSKSVHYRYGGFRGRFRLDGKGGRQPVIAGPDGTIVPDLRNGYWSPPPWVTDLFPFPELSGTSDAGYVGDGRFSIIGALSSSNSGGIYEGRDQDTGRKVILKEARPYVEVGRYRVDAISLLRKEYRLLQQLSGSGYFAEPVAFFQEWEHAFLVEEFVPGSHLGRFTITNHPLYRSNFSTTEFHKYLDTMRRLWLEINNAIATAHQCNIVLGDISFTNIIVTEELKIKMIDLEAAVEEGVDAHVGIYTPGISSPEATVKDASDRAGDYRAFGAIMFGSLALVTNMTGFYPPARLRFVAELMADLDVPAQLIDLIEDLIGSATLHPSTPEAMTRRLNALPLLAKVKNTAKTCRLARGAVERMERDDPRELRRRARATVDGIVRYLHATASPGRSDRLFPGDLAVFETNPLSVAYGAAGVLYALLQITGKVPRPLLTWMLRREVASSDYPPGLYLGQSGIAWVLAQMGQVELAVQIMRDARRHELLFESPDIMYGAAGYGLACLKLWRSGAGDEFLHEAIRAGSHIAESAEQDQRGARWRSDDGIVPLGYAYGGSGIALFLLYLHLATGEAEPLRLGRKALGFELAQAAWLEGVFAGFPAQVADEPEQPLVLRCYWDAGSAGVGTALIRYLAVAPDDILEDWVPTLASDACRKYASFPQLFHGLAGLGNFLLDVWAQTGEDRYLAEAWQVAEGVQLFRIDRAEGLAFPGEQAVRESADFATGAAGVGLFLHRLLSAGKGISDNFNFVVDELLRPNQTMAHPGKSLRA
jgi:tRNA A-37 threonylcarbamoyl transferase component Bud32